MPFFEYCQRLDLDYPDKNPCAGEDCAADPSLQPHDTLASVLQLAGAVIELDADSAALLLDGVLLAIAAQWFHKRGLARPPAYALLPALQAEAPALAGRLRLAMHAPLAQERLVHAWALLHDELGAA